MKPVLLPVTLALLAGTVAAKLPPPSDAAKAKQAEAATKAAWQAKVDAYELCKAQDRVAAVYRKNAGQAAASTAKAAAASQPASAATGTPVASAPPPPCMDPGPFATNDPQQKPLETSEAHSPAGTAASPPSVKQHSGAIQPPAKKP